MKPRLYPGNPETIRTKFYTGTAGGSDRTLSGTIWGASVRRYSWFKDEPTFTGCDNVRINNKCLYIDACSESYPQQWRRLHRLYDRWPQMTLYPPSSRSSKIWHQIFRLSTWSLTLVDLEPSRSKLQEFHIKHLEIDEKWWWTRTRKMSSRKQTMALRTLTPDDLEPS